MEQQTDPDPVIRVVSFGYLHGPPPAAHLVADVRKHFRDPHIDPGMRALTSSSARVRETVLNTPGVPDLIAALAAAAAAMAAGPARADVAVAVGCAGGKHRAPTIAQEIVVRLEASGLPAAHERWHEAEPVVNR